jgi:hypothetical protein
MLIDSHYEALFAEVISHSGMHSGNEIASLRSQ